MICFRSENKKYETDKKRDAKRNGSVYKGECSTILCSMLFDAFNKINLRMREITTRPTVTQKNMH